MRIRPAVAALAAIALCIPALRAQTAAKPMTMYFIDTEGGHSVLYISPAGESLLEDTGFPGDRDHDRIMAAIADAGLKQIDYLVVTHYHVDHVGGVEALAKAIPIRHFIDHGPTVEPREQVAGFQAMYKDLNTKTGVTHTVVKPGDKIPVSGLNVEVVTSAGEVLKKPIPGAPGAGKLNPECADFKKQAENPDPENAQSIGLVYAYGKFRTINLGDYVFNKDVELMCPNNPIGTVDLYLTPNHGSDQSGSAVLVHALQPRVAIMHNGSRKGGSPQAFQILHTSPGLEDIWQLHYSYTAALENNTAGVYIANIEDPAVLGAAIANPAPPPAPGGGRGASGAAGGRGGSGGRGGGGAGGGRGAGHTGPAFWLKVTAQPDGSFTVFNTRNNFSKTYGPRKN
jgi:competence protein ComEC